MRVKLDFQGGALALFGYGLLTVLLAYLLLVPAAWGYAMLFAFVARNTRMSDGGSVSFVGRGSEIWWMLLLAVVPFFVPVLVAGPNLNNPNAGPSPLFGVLMICAVIVSLYFAFLLLKWMIGSIQFSSGGRLSFNGGFLPVLGWMFLIYASGLLIILPFWGMSAFIGWIFRNTTSSGGERLIWTGSGWQLLWRTVVVYLLSILIIPIPWIMRWWLRWFIGCVEVEK